MHDAKSGKELLKPVMERIKRIFADRGYDSKAIFNEFGSNTVIPDRKNALTRSRGSPSRSKIVSQIKRTSEKE
ncbi:MAG: transposase, IS4 family protein [Thermoplasmatales archaeon Gpl]|nr:MAG: transposase, IS4 family protein [Thermoplasmatales archaeon Gpl]